MEESEALGCTSCCNHKRKNNMNYCKTLSEIINPNIPGFGFAWFFFFFYLIWEFSNTTNPNSDDLLFYHIYLT